jgi:AraC-like DNA-binding protein
MLPMKIDFTWPVVICGAMIVLGFFAAFPLWLSKENRRSNRYLSILLLTIALWLIDFFFTISGVYGQDPDFYFKPIYYSFAFGPLIYFYVKSLTNSAFRFRSIHLLHFIPVIAQAGLYWFLTFKDYEFRNWYWQQVHLPWTYRIEFNGTFLSLAIYIGLSFWLLRSYQKWVNNNFSESSRIRLDWLRLLLALFILLCVQWLVEVILREAYEIYFGYNYSVLILGLLTLILAYSGLDQESLAHIIYHKSNEDAESKKIDIDGEILSKIQDRMENSRDYLDPSLTLKEFSDLLKIPRRTISEHLNHGLHKSFHDFVNSYRVEEVKRKLLSDDREKFTIESIAYDSGFNSKATFNRIFKKFTGVSPSNFIA